VRRAAWSLAAALGVVRPCGPAGRGRRGRQRLARGRLVPRRLDSRLRCDLAAGTAARGLACGRHRRCALEAAQPGRRDRDVGTEELRPAFYALRSGGWRDYVTVLHLPYTAWNLSYVALGAAIAPRFHTDRMVWTMAAFGLALGISAHVLDELNGRPLGTEIPNRVLVALGIGALAGACGIG